MVGEARDLLDVLPAVVREPEQAPGEERVPAAKVLGGLLQHQDRGALLGGGQCGVEAGVAGAHHENIDALGEIQGRSTLPRTYGLRRGRGIVPGTDFERNL